jgi:hypothetical protein
MRRIAMSISRSLVFEYLNEDPASICIAEQDDIEPKASCFGCTDGFHLSLCGT